MLLTQRLSHTESSETSVRPPVVGADTRRSGHEEELLLCRYAEAMLIRGEQQLKRNEEERLRAQRAWCCAAECSITFKLCSHFFLRCGITLLNFV